MLLVRADRHRDGLVFERNWRRPVGWLCWQSGANLSLPCKFGEMQGDFAKLQGGAVLSKQKASASQWVG